MSKKSNRNKKQTNIIKKCKYCGEVGRIISLGRKNIIGPGYICWDIKICTNCNRVQ